MKIITFNCNGIRSSLSKGLLEYLRNENPDIICFQETKAPKSEIERKEFFDLGFQIFSSIAEKAGYSGTTILTKLKPKKIEIGYGGGIFQTEGRSVLLEYPNFKLWNLYFPSGTSGEERQKIKYKFLDEFLQLVLPLKDKKKPLLICGDVNIAHTALDIHNPKGNIKNSGFLPEEREWMSRFLDQGFVDLFRSHYPEVKDIYSWWSYRFNARKQNKGWRIDYFFADQKSQSLIRDIYISTEPILSDHAPVVLDIQIT